MNDQVIITNTQSVQFEIQAMLIRSAVKDYYKDVKVVCKDNTVWGPRVILALAYPLMAEILRDRNEDKELVLILPDFTAQEVNTRVSEFLCGDIKEEVMEENVEDEVIKDIGEGTVKSVKALEEQGHEEYLSDLDIGSSNIEKIECSLDTGIASQKATILEIPVMEEEGM